MLNRRRIALFVFVSLAAIPAYTKDTSSLEARIKSDLQRRVFALKHAYAAGRLRFDPNGNLIGDNRTGPWTLYGRVEIAEVHLKPDDLRIVANRIYALYDDAKQQFKYLRSDNGVTIDVRLVPGELTEQTLAPLLSTIFIGSRENFADYVPPYWKPFLTDQAKELKTFTRTINLDNAASDSTHQGIGVAAKGEGPIILHGQEVYRVGGSVKPPRGRYTPDPHYVEVARLAKIQGKVILLFVLDQSGMAGDIFVTKPLGMGLDEAAMEAVRTWKFEPATREGKAVRS